MVLLAAVASDYRGHVPHRVGGRSGAPSEPSDPVAVRDAIGSSGMCAVPSPLLLGRTITAGPSGAATLRLGGSGPPAILFLGIRMTDPCDHVADQLIAIDPSKCSGWADTPTGEGIARSREQHQSCALSASGRERAVPTAAAPARRRARSAAEPRRSSQRRSRWSAGGMRGSRSDQRSAS